MIYFTRHEYFLNKLCTIVVHDGLFLSNIRLMASNGDSALKLFADKTFRTTKIFQPFSTSAAA